MVVDDQEHVVGLCVVGEVILDLNGLVQKRSVVRTLMVNLVGLDA